MSFHVIADSKPLIERTILIVTVLRYFMGRFGLVPFNMVCPTLRSMLSKLIFIYCSDLPQSMAGKLSSGFEPRPSHNTCFLLTPQLNHRPMENH